MLTYLPLRLIYRLIANIFDRIALLTGQIFC